MQNKYVRMLILIPIGIFWLLKIFNIVPSPREVLSNEITTNERLGEKKYCFSSCPDVYFRSLESDPRYAETLT